MDVVEISIIIPTHRRCEVLDALLNRIRDISQPRHEVIVIDDASTDGTADMLRRSHPEVRVLRNDSARGFDALPDAIALARGGLVFQLDDDAFPGPDTLARVVDHFRRRGAKLGVAALPFFDPSTGRRARTSYLPDTDGERHLPTHGFLAGAVVLRTEAARSIPPSPPGYFMYGTEPAALIEYLEAGWEADVLPDAPVFHLWSGRSRRLAARTAYLPLRNDIVTIKRYYRGWRRSEMLVGRYLTGYLHLLAAGRPQDWRRALRDADRMLQRLPRRGARPETLERVYACFTGLTLATLVSRVNLRRLGWLAGLVPVDQIA